MKFFFAFILFLLILATGSGAAETNKPAGPITLNSLVKMVHDAGFFLTKFNGVGVDRIPLDRVDRQGNLLHLASSKLDGYSFDVEVRECPRHLALILRKANGDFDDRSVGLEFYWPRTKSSPCMVLPIDYMVVDRSRRGRMTLSWPYLWNKNPADPLGGFAIAWQGTDAENDAALAEIWTTESFPHPDIGRPWTEAEVWKWIDAYYTKYSGLSETIISAINQEDLYYITDKLHEGGIRRIYLFTDTWRKEYWPRHQSFVNVSTNVFTNGRSDLVKYGEYLHKKGMQLKLHSVSAGIGRNDPEFVKKGDVDPRVESWFHGVVEQPLDAKSKELFVRPDPGVSIPALRLGPQVSISDFVVGREIIGVGDVLDSDGPVWRLKITSRGAVGSAAAAHGAGTRVTGLLAAWGQNYLPDPRTDLMAEFARRFADLINDAQLDHQHYDGSEIHKTDQEWGFDKLTYLIAGAMRHPTGTTTSGGGSTKWNIERLFSKIAPLKELNYRPMYLPISIECPEKDRNATTWLDAHYAAAVAINNDARRLGFDKPTQAFEGDGVGLSRVVMERYGLTPDMLGLARQWKQVLKLLNDEDVAYVKEYFTRIPARPGFGKWMVPEVPVLVEKTGKYYFVPTRILLRAGRDAPWMHGAEFGLWAPRQYIPAGDKITLENPYKAQAPGLVLRVLPALATTGTGPDSKAGKKTKETIWPNSINQEGNSQVLLKDGAILVSGSNPHEIPYLETDKLSWWTTKFTLNDRRAMEIEVEGDGSGAVLVVQLDGPGKREYVVKLDFTGTKRLVIANGEVSWADAAWGWRFGAKDFVYTSEVGKMRVGFGYLPPKCNAKATIRSLRILDNVPAVLRNPVFSLGGGALSVKGDVRPGEYLTYEADKGVKVFDNNWNFIKDLPFEAKSFVVGAKVDFSFTGDGGGPKPWLEVQILTRGEPYEIGKNAR